MRISSSTDINLKLFRTFFMASSNCFFSLNSNGIFECDTIGCVCVCMCIFVFMCWHTLSLWIAGFVRLHSHHSVHCIDTPAFQNSQSRDDHKFNDHKHRTLLKLIESFWFVANGDLLGATKNRLLDIKPAHTPVIEPVLKNVEY